MEYFDQKTNIKTSEKELAIEKIQKYPDQIDDNKALIENQFYFPRKVIPNTSSIDSYDKYVLSVICYHGTLVKGKLLVARNIRTENIVGLIANNKSHAYREKPKVLKSIKNLNRLEGISIQDNDFGGYDAYVSLESGYQRISVHEYERVMSLLSGARKVSAVTIYLAINEKQYKKPENEDSYISYAMMKTLSDETGVSSRTITRALGDLEEIKAIAIYTVSMGNGASIIKRNIISNYVHRDKLRRHVQRELFNSDGKYVFLHDTRKGEENGEY